MTRPKSATAYWLKKLGAEPVDFLPPRSGGIDGVEVVARVQKDNFEKVLRGSGEFGVFSRPFFVKGDARVYKDAPLPAEFDLQAALRKAKAVGPSILGVVMRGEGLGLRTKECDFESVVGQVYSEEEAKRFIGKRWEATNLPLSWSKGAVQAFLAGWPCTVEASFRAGKTRSAIIRSAVPLPHRRLQHDFGCSLIRPAEPRKRQRAQVIVVKTGKNYSGKSKGCKILGECGPRKPHATSDSETSARWKRVDGHDSSRCHHSHPGSRQQPGTHAGLALAKVATDGHPATSAISSAGRRGRAATGTHGVGTVDCDNCRTARGPAAFPPNRSHGNEKRRQRGRRVRRARWFLLRIWRERERGGHGRCPWRAKIQLCQTYAVLSGEKEGAVFKASRRVFVAFSSFAVLFCSARSSPTVNISQVFARKEVQFSEKRWLFFAVSEGCGAAFTKESMLA